MSDTTEIQRIVGDCYEQLYTSELDNLEEMDKFLETYNFPRLNHEEIRNLDKVIQNKEVESVIKKKSLNNNKKAQDQVALLVNSIKHLKNTNYSQTLPRN